jgi:hypothetical protein
MGNQDSLAGFAGRIRWQDSMAGFQPPIALQYQHCATRRREAKTAP